MSRLLTKRKGERPAAIRTRAKRSATSSKGEGEILMEGQAPLKVQAGDGFIVPGGTKHDARNTGTQPPKLVAIYVVEKGKPLATPAP